MKSIYIPKPLTIRLNYDDDLTAESDSQDDLKIIDENGSQIITGATLLEDRMIEALSKILFGTAKENSGQKSFFIEEVISTSDFSFSFKRRAFTRALEQFSIIDTEQIKELKSGLNKVMLWRNSFAHGKVIKKLKGGYILTYYSGGHKEQDLDDEFFETVENTIRNCLYTCNGIIQSET